MKLVRFKLYASETAHRVGVLQGEKILELSGSLFGPLDQVIAEHEAAGVIIGPAAAPSKVVCVGLNYRDHAEEVGMEIPTEPLLFLKPASSVIGPGSPIVRPRASQRVDFEAELGVVMGRPAKKVSQEEALGCVLGYTCVNDVTARDLQISDGQWTRAKGFDTFCPLGPVVETELDTANLRVQALLNGKTLQDSNTSNLIFNVSELIVYISAVMTLLPGDVIATGTPAGIGPMVAGDQIEIRIEGLGSLTNPVLNDK